MATAYSLAWPGLDTQWALRKVLTEWGGAWLPFRELPGEGKPQRGESTVRRLGVDRGKEREKGGGRAEKVGPREKRGREKNGVENREGTHPNAGRGAGRRTQVGGAGEGRQGGRAAASHSAG